MAATLQLVKVLQTKVDVAVRKRLWSWLHIALSPPKMFPHGHSAIITRFDELCVRMSVQYWSIANIQVKKAGSFTGLPHFKLVRKIIV